MLHRLNDLTIINNVDIILSSRFNMLMNSGAFVADMDAKLFCRQVNDLSTSEICLFSAGTKRKALVLSGSYRIICDNISSATSLF